MSKDGKTKPTLAGSTYDKAETSPGFLFWKAFNAWNRRLRQELDRLELTQAQFSILAAVSYLGSDGAAVSQQEVATQLSMDKMMVSDVCKTLQQKKWLVRSAHPEDGRAIALRLTAESRRLLKRAVPAVEAVDESFFGVLPLDQQKALLLALSALVPDENNHVPSANLRECKKGQERQKFSET